MESVAPLSKKALKRKAREEETKLKKLQKREEEKKRKKEAAKAKRDPDIPTSLPRLPHEPPNLNKTAKQQAVVDSFNQHKSSVTFCIDASFDHLMLEHEKKSIAQQFVYSYNSNKHAATPVNLHFCGFGPLEESFTGKRLLDQNADKHWPSFAGNLHAEPLETVFPKDRLVYLSADAEDVLTELNPHKVYVIGGIVDRNRHKGLCAKKAKQLGIPTAKFPLDQYFSKVGFSRVLTTNHCVDILLEFIACGGEWMQACRRGVPLRKTREKTKPKRGEDDNLTDHAEGELVLSGEEITSKLLELNVVDKAVAEMFTAKNVNSKQLRSLQPLLKELERLGVQSHHDRMKIKTWIRETWDPRKPKTTTEVASMPPPRTKRAIIIGSSSLSLSLAQHLFNEKWSVFIVEKNETILNQTLQNVRNSLVKNQTGTPEEGNGEVLGMVATPTVDGDVIRLKDVLDHRFADSPILDALFLNGGDDDNVLGKAIPIREMYKDWLAKNSSPPKITVAMPKEMNDEVVEWNEGLKLRYPDKVLECVENSTTLLDIVQFLNS